MYTGGGGRRELLLERLDLGLQGPDEGREVRGGGEGKPGCCDLGIDSSPLFD